MTELHHWKPINIVNQANFSLVNLGAAELLVVLVVVEILKVFGSYLNVNLVHRPQLTLSGPRNFVPKTVNPPRILHFERPSRIFDHYLTKFFEFLQSISIHNERVEGALFVLLFDLLVI